MYIGRQPETRAKIWLHSEKNLLVFCFLVFFKSLYERKNPFSEWLWSFKESRDASLVKALRVYVGRMQNGPWEILWEKAVQFQEAQKGHQLFSSQRWSVMSFLLDNFEELNRTWS